MNYIFQSITQAFKLIASFDGEVILIVWTSLRISVTSTIISSLVAVPLGVFLALKDFKGKKAVNTICNTLMALPTVVVGLLVYSFITRRAPLGVFGLLYTPAAIVVGQCLLIIPLITAMVYSITQTKEKKIFKTALGLGATGFQAFKTFLWEIRLALLTAIMLGFGRVIGEVGVSMLLGGNIYHVTRTLTTAIALENSKGELSFALALGIILMAIALGVNSLITFLNSKTEQA